MINLMPPEIKKAIRYASKNVTLLRVNFVIVSLIAIMSLVTIFGITIVRSDEANLRNSVSKKEEQLAQFSDTLVEAEDLANTIETINTLIEQEEKFSILLRQLGSLMPEGSRLTALTLSNDRSEQVQISAVTDTQSIATTLQNNLANSELFIGADIQNITANLDGSGDPTDYTVIIITAFEGSQDPTQTSDTLPTEDATTQEQGGGQ